MRFPRCSGILLHPTSLPGLQGRFGRFRRGCLPPFGFFRAGAGQQLWQVMPLCPTGHGDSPYQGFSAFAGNPLLISLDQLIGEGLLAPEDLTGLPTFSYERVDYGTVIPFKLTTLQVSSSRSLQARGHE